MKSFLFPLCLVPLLFAVPSSRADSYVPTAATPKQQMIDAESLKQNQIILPLECLVLRHDPSAPETAWKNYYGDIVQQEMITETFKSPSAGDVIEGAHGQKYVWSKVSTINPGLFDDGDLARASYFSVNLDKPQTMILCASCHRLAYVNGELHFGDVYGLGYSAIPVSLHTGRNDIVITGVNGSELSCRLQPVPSDAFVNAADPTLPDLIVGKSEKLLGAVVVGNALNKSVSNLMIKAKTASGAVTLATPVPELPALSIRKVGFAFNSPALSKAGSETLVVTLVRKTPGREEVLDTQSFDLGVRAASECRKITFVSKIDGSVQYYALNPASGYGNIKSPDDSWKKEPPALVLSLHGASVEAIGQARAYESKTWANIVCPTNRRPYGFDWENWGRLDALEVLDDAESKLSYSPDRIYLTGHSMGGHGTWQLGALYPGKFAAIAPCSGWISFDTYGGKRSTGANGPLNDLLERALLPSQTLSMKSNYSQEGIYILHGVADETVSVDQARRMRDELSKFHRDFVYHEEPGQGHWWDINDEPGADCEDYADLFDFLSRHRLPDDQSVREVNFVTPDPGISSRCHWLSIDAQIHRLKLSSADLKYDPGMRRFTGTTQNVAYLGIDVTRFMPQGTVKIVLDGQTIDNIALKKGQTQIDLSLSDSGSWSVGPALPKTWETPERCGPFKNAFCNRMVFVIGTIGSAEENRWSLAKARFDSEVFWYIGNGSVDIVTDKEYLAGGYKDRNVILYGNSDTNAAWKKLLVGSPIQVKRGEIEVGSKSFAGDNYTALFLRPIPGSALASVGVVAGTGGLGQRAANRMTVFSSALEYPDYIVFSTASMAFPGTKTELAGFYGLDWSLQKGDQAAADK